MVFLQYHHRLVPRFFSISSSTLPSLHSHLFPLSIPARFSSSSSASAVAPKSHLAVADQLHIGSTHRTLAREEPQFEIPLEKLFVPPEVELPAAAAGTWVASARVLKGSNILLGPYARDAQVSAAEFVKSSTRTEDCPADGLPEFALVGRSNVGKSSLLNSLVRRKRLALISKKPGKTQCINHFRINDSWYLVDLPGYGYASAPKELRINWYEFTKQYFLKRETLVSVFLLIDASIPAKKIDLEYASWLGQNQMGDSDSMSTVASSIETDSDNEGTSNVASTSRAQFLAQAKTVTVVSMEYYNTYLNKAPCMDSTQTGAKWVKELLDGHPIRFYNMFRMSKVIFIDLLHELETNYGLVGGRKTTSVEIFAIFVYVLAQNCSNRATSERFQHSGETISRHFKTGLRAVIGMSANIIVPLDPLFSSTPKEIGSDSRYMPYFKNCIGAIDGTHVDARVPQDKKAAYIGRSSSPTQNVMAVCDFNMCFTFAFSGWEGTAHDSRIFDRALRDRSLGFPLPPQGKFYVVDSGYPLRRGFLKPYRHTRYHLPDFARASRALRGPKEVFNQRHSSLRSVIERTIGVWKKKWVILRDMPNYSFDTQRLIIIATMTLYNFIRRHSSRVDLDFAECDENDNYLGQQSSYEDCINVDTECLTVGKGASEMEELRFLIATQSMNARF